MYPINANFGQGLTANPFGPVGAQSEEMMLAGMATLLATFMQLASSLPTGNGQLSAGTGFPQVTPSFGGGGGGSSSGAPSVSNFLGSSQNTGGGGSIGEAPSKGTTDKGEIQGFIGEAAKAYGADSKVLTEMARRESNFQTGVQNNWDSNAKKGTPSKGLFQFIEPTFKSMAPKAKAANPKAWEGLGEFDWNDWRQQALTAAWAITHGQGSAWSTYKASGGK